MTISTLRTNPDLIALTANPDCPPEVVCDWLAEHGATLADLLQLYAGEPPDYEGDVPQAVLAAWCKATEPEKEVQISSDAPQDIYRPVWVNKRWQQIEVIGKALYQPMLEKRRVLRLFAEVKFERETPIKDYHDRQTFDDWMRSLTHALLAANTTNWEEVPVALYPRPITLRCGVRLEIPLRYRYDEYGMGWVRETLTPEQALLPAEERPSRITVGPGTIVASTHGQTVEVGQIVRFNGTSWEASSAATVNLPVR